MKVENYRMVFQWPILLWLIFSLSACSLLLPGPDKLNEDLAVPMGKWDGVHHYYNLIPVMNEPGNYERQGYFKGDFRGNDLEFLINLEKKHNQLIMVASALAGQPIFAIQQSGRQLTQEQSYFDLKGLKFSWFLADYQWVNMPLSYIRPPLLEAQVGVVDRMVEDVCLKPVNSQEEELVETRYLFPFVAEGVDNDLEASSFMTIQYFTESVADYCQLLGTEDSAKRKLVSSVSVTHKRWKYTYKVKVL